jgi:lipopolysaccharide biosynthesis glycosyltransferase
MTVVFCVDENFVQHLLVALTSLCDHNPTNILEVYIVDGGVTEQSKKLLRGHSTKSGYQLKFIHIDTSLYSDFLVDGHISRATYYRISVPELLPAHDKAMYLDCDIIINNSIEDLWTIDLGTNALAAAPERTNIRNREMGLGNTKTFNAGVLLLNLKKWREERLTAKVLRYIYENPDKIKFHDQDALNGVLVNDWLELPIKWNLTAPYVSPLEKVRDKEMLEQINNPAIVHFSESFKPWHYQLRHPYKHLYYKYLNNTEFKSYTPPDRTLINVLKKTASLTLIYLHLKK